MHDDAPTTPAGRPGPRPTYTREAIADSGLRLADESGIDSLSMRRVAGDLGTAAASLYRYVAGKEELVTLVADRAIAEVEEVDLTGDVRTDVLAVMQSMRMVHRRHPWLAQLSTNRVGPQGLRLFDRLVGALTPAGLGIGETMTAAALLSGWVGTYASREATGPATDELAASVGMTSEVMGELPHLAALMATATEEPPHPADEDAVFEASVDTLLYGIIPR